MAPSERINKNINANGRPISTQQDITHKGDKILKIVDIGDRITSSNKCLDKNYTFSGSKKN